MEKELGLKLIEELEKRNKIDDAYFGIFQYGGGPDESFIKANKEGLQLMSAFLLKSSLEIDERNFEKGKWETIQLDSELMDEMSDSYLSYIELKNSTKAKIEFESDTFGYQRNLKDKFLELGCLIVVLIGVLIFIIGVVSVFGWFF